MLMLELVKNMLRLSVGFLLVLEAVFGQSEYEYDYVTECPPDENGFFADLVQCDKYYQCKDGEVRKLSHI